MISYTVNKKALIFRHRNMESNSVCLIMSFCHVYLLHTNSRFFARLTAIGVSVLILVLYRHF